MLRISRGRRTALRGHQVRKFGLSSRPEEGSHHLPLRLMLLVLHLHSTRLSRYLV